MVAIREREFPEGKLIRFPRPLSPEEIEEKRQSEQRFIDQMTADLGPDIPKRILEVRALKPEATIFEALNHYAGKNYDVTPSSK